MEFGSTDKAGRHEQAAGETVNTTSIFRLVFLARSRGGSDRWESGTLGSATAIPAWARASEIQIPRVEQGQGIMPGGPNDYIAYGEAWANVSNAPHREYKHFVHEGGISTPLIAHWPAGIPEAQQGKISTQPGHLIDIMATCATVAKANYPAEFNGQKIQPMEGVSLMPAFQDRSLDARSIFWEHEGNRAHRAGPWKLVSKERKPWELYNIDQDRAEMHDLAAAEPERVQAMAKAWDYWAEDANVLPIGAWKKPDIVKNAKARRSK